jgi:small subunit ribosomal protein S2
MADIIEEIKENIEKGEDALEEVVEDVVEKVKGKKRAKKTDKEKLSGKALEKAAEAESTTKESELEEKKKKLLEKVKKLKGKIESGEVSTEELKEKVKVKKRTDMLVPLEEYVKSGIYLGTRVVTPSMKPFVYRRRADGLAIFNTDIIDEKMKEGIEYLSGFAPEEVILVCKRQSGWKAAQMFSNLTGIKVFAKKYPAGILTNTRLPDFFENELTIVCDSWLDKNALHDTINVHKKVLMVCDTNNFAQGADKIVIGNNKSPKSLGLIFYLLARGYCKARGIEADIPDLEMWMSEEEILTPVDEKLEKVDAEFGV